MTVYILAVSAVIFLIAVLISMKKSGHFIKSLTFSALQGITSLFAVNAAGIFTGVSLNINALTLVSAVFFGIPGIVFHLIAKIIIK